MSLSQIEKVSETDNEIQSILKAVTTDKCCEQPVKQYEKMKFEFKENQGYYNIRKNTTASSHYSLSR